jgi:teichuronic acid biosynthesis glycosyltransferase TuaC
MEPYTLGLFANMYPAFEGDYRGIFIQQMVRDLEDRGITVKKAVKISSSVTGYIPFYWQSLLLARDSFPDILQAEYIPHSSIIPAFLKKSSTPLVLKFHGDDGRIYPFENPFNKALTRAMIRRADFIVTSSEEIRAILISLGAEPENSAAVHTGVDTDFFHPVASQSLRTRLGLPDDVPVFLFIGRLHPWKGLDEMISVAKKCPRFLFVFIGPGTVPSHPQNCLFTGIKKPDEVRNWLNAADCLLLPSYTEGFPTVIMEAFACGKPVIATRVGGCPELVEPGKTGMLIPARNAPALFESVLWMATHPGERSQMGEEARTIARDRFDHIKMVQKLIGIHESLIRKA